MPGTSMMKQPIKFVPVLISKDLQPLNFYTM